MNLFDRYAELGIPLHTYSIDAKGSNEPGWPERAKTTEGSPEELHSRVGKRNFGALTGIDTGNGFLADVDFDSEKQHVRFAAAGLLPPSANFGRRSKPGSHILYLTERPVRLLQLKNVDDEMLLELRGTKKDGSLGLQTMVPPSIHPGDKKLPPEQRVREPLEWSDPAIPLARVPAAELERRFLLAAVVSIVLENTEGKHLGHDARLGAAALFKHLGLTRDEATEALEAIAVERNVGDPDDVRRAIEGAFSGKEKLQTRDFVAFASKPVVDRIKEWFNAQDQSREVVTQRASEIQPKATRWLWQDWLPLGENALMTGREDTGKSTVLLDLVAQVTRGLLPGDLDREPRDVIIATTEDSWEHTIVPRLLAADADLERVHRVAVRVENVGEIELSLPDDVKGLEKKILELRVAMVVIDPLIPKLNRKLDSHKDAEVRQGLEPLIGVAHRTGCSIVGIVHHNKSATTDPLNAVMGSKAFVAAVRAVMSVIIEEDQDSGEETRYLCLPKHNLGTAQPSLTFEIKSVTVGEDEGRPITAGKIWWTGRSRDSAARIMTRKAKGESPRDKGEEWLEQFLKRGTTPSAEVKKEAKALGFKEGTLKRAAQKLNIKVTTQGRATLWSLPEF